MLRNLILVASILVVVFSGISKDYLSNTGTLDSTSKTSIDSVNFNENASCVARAFDFNIEIHCKNANGSYELHRNFTTLYKMYYTTFSADSQLLIAGGSNPQRVPASIVYVFGYSNTTLGFEHQQNFTFDKST